MIFLRKKCTIFQSPARFYIAIIFTHSGNHMKRPEEKLLQHGSDFNLMQLKIAQSSPESKMQQLTN